MGGPQLPSVGNCGVRGAALCYADSSFRHPGTAHFITFASYHRYPHLANPTVPFRQKRYYDRNESGHKEFIEKLKYIYRDPVKRRLVDRPILIYAR